MDVPLTLSYNLYLVTYTMAYMDVPLTVSYNLFLVTYFHLT
jgi:hypothetical protein